jgi:hypothetical protein
VTATQGVDTAQSAAISAIQAQLNLVASNPALQLGQFVTVDLNPENGVRGPNIVFTGVNIHLVSGSGTTNDHVDGTGVALGLGNLIIGYNFASPWELQPGDRGASHMLVIGDENKYTQFSYGGIVCGAQNTVNGAYSSIIGGEQNTINEPISVEIGGLENTLNGPHDGGNVLVGGGGNSVTNGAFTVLLGGDGNRGNPTLYSTALGAQEGQGKSSA